jgi:hypothetical protein
MEIRAGRWSKQTEQAKPVGKSKPQSARRAAREARRQGRAAS